MTTFKGEISYRQLLGGPTSHKLSGVVLDAQQNPKIAVVACFEETGITSGDLGPVSYRAIAITRSNSQGQWSVKGLENIKHTVISYDHTGEFDPVLKGGLIPEPME